MTKEHVLVCIGASPTTPKVIDAAVHMASSSNAGLTALFVETPDFQNSGRDLKRLLEENFEYAKKAGAAIDTVYGDNIVQQIEEYAKVSGATKIVIGISPDGHRSLFGRTGVAQQLYYDLPDKDIYVIPLDIRGTLSYNSRRILRQFHAIRPVDIFITAGLLAIATAVGLLFARAGMEDSNIIPLYLMAVLIVSVATASSVCGILTSLLSVFIFNYFFTSPRFSLRAYDPQYWITFLVMFIASILTSSLTIRLREYATHAAQNSYGTGILLNTNRLLQQADGPAQIAAATADQIVKLMECAVLVYLPEQGVLRESGVFLPVGAALDEACRSAEEKEAAEWSWKNGRVAGSGTADYASCRMRYLPISIRDHTFGVFGLDLADKDPDPYLTSLVSSILDECALAMENERNEREMQSAAEAARNQKLRADLLRSISHDLRTPLTSISGNASLLLSGDSLAEADKKRIYSDIYDDSVWLIDVVQNLLAITRLENGRVDLSRKAELMDEVILEALKHIDRNSEDHEITTQFSDDILLASMDAKLMVQVVVNIVNNAVKYTQSGSQIRIRSYREAEKIYVVIADDGPGMPDKAKAHAFEMFWTGANAVADARRSLGLGLALCRSIIEAHDGEITIKDNIPKGTVVTFWLPAEEVRWNE